MEWAWACLCPERLLKPIMENYGLKRGKMGALVSALHYSPKVKDETVSSGCAGYFGKTDSGKEIINLIKRIVEPSMATFPKGQ